MLPPTFSRRNVLLTVLLILAIAGGSVLSVSIASQRAIAAEEAYVSARLENASCLTNWGINEGAAYQHEKASLSKLTARGIKVDVQIAYAYRTTTDEGQTVYADSVSHAVYLVTPANTYRSSGDTISPC